MTSACVMCNVHVKEDKYTNVVVPIVRLVGLLPLANARPRQDVMGKVHVQCIILYTCIYIVHVACSSLLQFKVHVCCYRL